MSKIFAVITDNIVSNTIVATTKEDADFATESDCIEISEDNSVSVGWSYDPETGQFTAPVVEAPEVIIEEPAAIEAPAE